MPSAITDTSTPEIVGHFSRLPPVMPPARPSTFHHQVTVISYGHRGISQVIWSLVRLARAYTGQHYHQYIVMVQYRSTARLIIFGNEYRLRIIGHNVGFHARVLASRRRR